MPQERKRRNRKAKRREEAIVAQCYKKFAEVSYKDRGSSYLKTLKQPPSRYL